MELDTILTAAKKIKLVVSDLDYTLLDDRRELTEYTKQTIRELRQAGVQFTICTARAGLMSRYYEQELELDAPFVGANGAAIVSPVTGEYLYLHGLDKEPSIGCIRLCLENNVQVVAITPHDIYAHIYREEDLNRFRSNIRLSNGNSWDGLKKMDRSLEELFRHEKIIKITMFDLNKEKTDKIMQYCKQYETLECAFSDNSVMGLSPRGEDKGTGLARLCDIMSLKKEEICAFGDYTTDIPMFRMAGLSFAVANGKEKAKEAASAICGGNNEDGVAKAIRKYFLRKE